MDEKPRRGSDNSSQIVNLAQKHVGSSYLDGLMRRHHYAAAVKEMAESPQFGVSRDVDPGVALLEEIHRTAGHVAWLHNKIVEMEQQELVWGKDAEIEEHKDGGGPTGNYTVTRTEMRAKINSWWDLYERERKHLVYVSTAALKAGIEERRVRLAERGVDALETALNGALERLGLDPHSARVREIVGASLREALGADIFGLGNESVRDTMAGVPARDQPRVIDALPDNGAPEWGNIPPAPPKPPPPAPVDF